MQIKLIHDENGFPVRYVCVNGETHFFDDKDELLFTVKASMQDAFALKFWKVFQWGRGMGKDEGKREIRNDFKRLLDLDNLLG